MNKLSFVVLVLMLFLTISIKADLTNIESRIAAIAEAEKEVAIQLLETVVNINSGTMNHPGVKKVADVFEKEFLALGMKTSWFDMKEVNRSGHLFAETRLAGDSSAKGKCILLVGHLDTVFEEDSDFQVFKRKGDLAHGPGVNDMKGGDVVIIQALKALQAVDELQNKKIIVALMGDEEKSGSPKSISRGHLVAAAKRCDIALGFEIATSLTDVTVARRGSSSWFLEVTGKPGHSAGIFREASGSGAIFEVARILNSFHEKLRGEEFLTFNPGTILGGTDVEYDPAQNKGAVFGKTNVIAQKVVVHGGLRTISPEQESHARMKMRALAENNHHNQTSAKITFIDGYPSMPMTEGNLAIMGHLNDVSVDLGYGEIHPYDPGKRGAADVSFIAAYVDVIDGIGAEGMGAHTPDESIDLSTLPLLIQRAAILIHRLSQVDKI